MDSKTKIISAGATVETVGETAASPIFSTWLRALLLRVYHASVVRFLFVSTISTVVDYVVLYAFLACLPKTGMKEFIAVAAGYLIGTIVNFVMARRIVFRPSGYHTSIEFVLVAIVAVVGLGLTLWITLTISHYEHWQDWHVLIAKTVAIVIVFFWNYFARRLLIYRTVGISEQ